MKDAYLSCLKKLREFRKLLLSEKDLKRGKLYFTWIKDKTEKIKNEQNEEMIYQNLVKYTLKNYDINKYILDKANNKIKSIIQQNYCFKNNKYVFNNADISIEDVKALAKYVIFKRGNVVWVDFGFNIGNEFGGMHPAIIIKNFDKELFVLPVSSKKPVEYEEIEKEYENKIITLEECEKRKNELTEIVELDKVYGFKNIIRWAKITRMRKVSILRLNFSGKIGAVSGKYMNIISDKISKEF